MTRMKESGIDWIGQIPEEWELGRVKDFYKFFTGFTPDTSRIEYYGDINDYVWVTIADMTSKKIESSKQTISDIFVKEKRPQVSRLGSLLYSFKLSVGKVAFANTDLYTNEAIATFEDGPNINLRFLYYSSYLIEFNSEINIYGAKLLNSERISNASIIYPSYVEQEKIADFLDKKTAQLDKVKALLEEQIQKLKDYRASLIYETVTKGLDKNVPMKDSEIDWIGQVPQGWGVSKLKNLLKIKDGTHDTPSYVDSGIPLITTKNINSFSNYIDFSTAKNISYKDYILINRRSDVEYGDILMPMIGTVGGAVQVTTKNSFSIKNVALFKAGFDLIMSKYLYYQLNSDIVNNQLEFLMSGGVQSFVSISILEQLQIINPSEKDKKKIVRFLDEKTQQIDKLIQIKNQQIENINKQRQTLIYDYVTGKRRV